MEGGQHRGGRGLRDGPGGEVRRAVGVRGGPVAEGGFIAAVGQGNFEDPGFHSCGWGRGVRETAGLGVCK